MVQLMLRQAELLAPLTRGANVVEVSTPHANAHPFHPAWPNASHHVNQSLQRVRRALPLTQRFASRSTSSVKSWLLSWLNVEPAAESDSPDALRELLDALDRLDPDRARHLARFAYLLGRVAHADQHVSADETAAMEHLVAREGQLPQDQAMLVVGLAKTSSLLFGGSDDFIIARDFATASSSEQKLALLRCLFAVSAVENSISIAEEREIQRIARELRIDQADVIRLRLEYKQHLPGLSGRTDQS